MRALAAAVLSAFCATSALANPDRAEWNPPARFDHPFSGKLVVRRLPQPEVIAACRDLVRGLASVAVTYRQRGCARLRDGRCTIIMIDRPFRGTRPEAVLRHEVGHCNGWPADHPQ